MEFADLVSPRDPVKTRTGLDWSLAHFALIGLALFAGSRWIAPEYASGGVRDARIIVSRAQVDAWSRQYETVSGKPATDDVRGAFIDRYVEDEMLYRESKIWGLAAGNQAIDLRLRQKMAFVSDADMSDDQLLEEAEALGLDADDAVIRNMLAHNMRLLLSRTGEHEPTEAEVEAFYAAEGSRFASPVRFTGRQIYFSRDARGASAVADARAAGRRIDAERLDVDAAAKLGDPGPFEDRFRGQIAHQLGSRFGESFAAAVGKLPVGEWSEPVETPFGAHLVFVESRTPPQVPPLGEIRPRVAAVYTSSQRDRRLAAAMDDLRARYQVVVE